MNKHKDPHDDISISITPCIYITKSPNHAP